MDKKLLFQIGVALLFVLLIIIGEYIDYDLSRLGYGGRAERRYLEEEVYPLERNIPLSDWVEVDYGTFSFKHPLSDKCGESQVALICLSELGGYDPDFVYSEWEYCNEYYGLGDDCEFTCDGEDFESYVEKTMAKDNTSSRRLLIGGRDAIEFTHTATNGLRKTKSLTLDLGRETGCFQISQQVSTPILDEIYEAIVSSIEFEKESNTAVGVAEAYCLNNGWDCTVEKLYEGTIIRVHNYVREIWHTAIFDLGVNNMWLIASEGDGKWTVSMTTNEGCDTGTDQPSLVEYCRAFDVIK